MPGIAKEYRVNERIRIPEVRVIDDQGQQLGVMATRAALELARERGLDLVEVAPNSAPPVCRLLDYGKFRYLQSTKEREARKSQKSVVVRQVRFRPKTGEHDIQSKERMVHRLLGQGSKVKLTVLFRGRELAHPDIGATILRRVAEGLKDEAKLEQAPSLEGRMMSVILVPIGEHARSSEDEKDGKESKESKKEMEHAKAEDA